MWVELVEDDGRSREGRVGEYCRARSQGYHKEFWWGQWKCQEKKLVHRSESCESVKKVGPLKVFKNLTQ